MLKRIGRAALILAALGLTGCFVYLPADVSQVPPGEAVRVRVSPAAVGELSAVMPGAESVIRGTLLRRDAAGLWLRVPVGVRREGFSSQPIAQDVEIATGNVLEVTRRQRSRTRTALFVGGTGVVAGAVIGMIMRGGRDPASQQIDPPDEIRVPLDR